MWAYCACWSARCDLCVLVYYAPLYTVSFYAAPF